MKFDYGYNFIRITFKEAEMNDSALTVGADPMLAKFPIIAYCEDTGALYTGAYDDGTVTLAAYGSGSGGSGGGGSVVFFPISIDRTGDTPDVTTAVSIPDITAAVKAGKYVILKDVGSEHIITLYPFSDSSEAFAGSTPVHFESCFSTVYLKSDSAEIINIYCKDVYNNPSASGFEIEIVPLTISEG